MRTRKRRVILTDIQILDIFHRAHAKDGETYRVIGRRFGISGLAVGYIARAQVHRHLFKTEAIDGAYEYLVSAVKGNVWARYRMTTGKRSKRRIV